MDPDAVEGFTIDQLVGTLRDGEITITGEFLDATPIDWPDSPHRIILHHDKHDGTWGGWTVRCRNCADWSQSHPDRGTAERAFHRHTDEEN